MEERNVYVIMENEKITRHKITRSGEATNMKMYKYNPDTIDEMWGENILLIQVDKQDERYVKYNEYVKSIENLPLKEFDVWSPCIISTPPEPDSPESWNPPIADDETLRPYFSNNNSPYFSLEVNENALTIEGVLPNTNMIMIPHHKKNGDDPIIARTFLEAVFKVVGVMQINPIDYFHSSGNHRSELIIRSHYENEEECVKASELPIKAWGKFSNESYAEAQMNYTPDDVKHPSFVGIKLPKEFINYLIDNLEKKLKRFR